MVVVYEWPLPSLWHLGCSAAQNTVGMFVRRPLPATFDPQWPPVGSFMGSECLFIFNPLLLVANLI